MVECIVDDVMRRLLWKNSLLRYMFFSISSTWGEPNPGVFLIYSRKINVRYPCMLQGCNKATVFINAVCVIYKFTVKEHRRYLEEHLGCMCFYYEIKSVVITCFCFCFLCCYFFCFCLSINSSV